MKNIETPAYIIDEKLLTQNLEILAEIQKSTGVKILTANKKYFTSAKDLTADEKY